MVAREAVASRSHDGAHAACKLLHSAAAPPGPGRSCAARAGRAGGRHRATSRRWRRRAAHDLAAGAAARSHCPGQQDGGDDAALRSAALLAPSTLARAARTAPSRRASLAHSFARHPPRTVLGAATRTVQAQRQRPIGHDQGHLSTHGASASATGGRGRVRTRAAGRQRREQQREQQQRQRRPRAPAASASC
eukprot:scaffold2135_cov341-Prasinococcus_capsulatus_cf.AAC.9